jgi:PIN domain nuclease of toxin-antitoxin system
MSLLLLDTHVLVWLLEDRSRVQESVFDRMEKAGTEQCLFVSAITPWEIAMLVSRNRLKLNRDVGEWVDAALALPGIRLTPLLPSIAIASTRLPWQVHSDPADRILLATARHLGATLVTADRRILEYAAQGFLHCLSAEG